MDSDGNEPPVQRNCAGGMCFTMYGNIIELGRQPQTCTTTSLP